MGRPKKAEEKKYKTLGVRTTLEWADWVETLAAEYRTTAAGIIDRALQEWADSKGYKVKPPRRVE